MQEITEYAVRVRGCEECPYLKRENGKIMCERIEIKFDNPELKITQVCIKAPQQLREIENYIRA